MSDLITDAIWDALSKVYNMDGVPDEAKSIIGDVMLGLPSAQPEQQWIPVSERLPEDVEEGQEYPTVIYSTNSGEVAAGWYEVLTQTWWRESASDDVIKDKVIAWKPLPEPYGGEQE